MPSSRCAEQGRCVGEHDDADLAVGEKQGEGEPGQGPVMADDSAAVEVAQENASPIPRILGSGPNWGDHICVSVCCRRIGPFCPTGSGERLCMGRHVGHRGMDRLRPK
jgi:hypothetical protein